MGKFWAILFGVTMAACFGLFLVAPFVGWWLPAGHSTHADAIDRLFYIILFITGFFFVLTEALLCVFMFRYGTQPDGKPAKPAPSAMANLIRPIAGVLNDPHKIELAWTIVPAAILLYIAFAQIGIWMEVKYQSRYNDMAKGRIPVVMEVSARQFEWRVRYPNKERQASFFANDTKKDPKVEKDFETFGKLVQYSDVHGVNEIHVVKDYPVLIHLGTMDVIHSLNFPHLRIKQDALPGKRIPVWFIPTTTNTTERSGKWVDGFNPSTKEVGDKDFIWDLACAELCGWGHYRMVGRLYVHKDQDDFLKWLEHAESADHAHSR